MGGHYVLCFYLSAQHGRAGYDTRAQCRCSLFAISRVVSPSFVFQKGIEWHLNAVSKLFFCPNMQLGHDAWADTACVGWFILLVRNKKSPPPTPLLLAPLPAHKTMFLRWRWHILLFTGGGEMNQHRFGSRDTAGPDCFMNTCVCDESGVCAYLFWVITFGSNGCAELRVLYHCTVPLVSWGLQGISFHLFSTDSVF